MQAVLKDDNVLHYDRTLVWQISYWFISTHGAAKAENYRKMRALSLVNRERTIWQIVLQACQPNFRQEVGAV